MRWSSPTLFGAVAFLSLALGCSPDSVSPPATDRPAASSGILTSFDKLTLSRGQSASFRASLIGSGARLSPAGLTFASRAGSVARVTAVHGRAQVQGLAAGRTWVVVQSAAASDSVEILVE